MKETAEQGLIAARPRGAKNNEAFMARTLAAVRKASANETFEHVMRTTNATKKERFIMKIKHIPRVALFGATTVVLGTSAYAATNWFGTQTQVQTNQNVVTVSAKDCPTPLWQAMQQNYPDATYSLSNTYKIINPSVITPAQIEQAQLATCEQRAVDAIAHKLFPNSYFGFGSNSKTVPVQNGLYSASGNYGTITAIDSKSVTVSDLPVNYINKPAARITVTLPIASTTKVLNDGQTADAKSLVVGDQIYFIFQRPANSIDVPAASAVPTDASNLLVIAKTQYDYRPIDVLFKANNDGAVRLTQSSDHFAG